MEENFDAGHDLGQVIAIYRSPASRMEMRTVDEVEVHTGGGLAGDRYEKSRHRHVSLFSTGELAEASEQFGSVIDPALTRRNVLVDGGMLPRKPGTRLVLGELALEVVRTAAPCKMLDMEIGDGAKTSLRRRAGVICRVLRGGQLRVGDGLAVADSEDSAAGG